MSKLKYRQIVYCLTTDSKTGLKGFPNAAEMTPSLTQLAKTGAGLVNSLSSTFSSLKTALMHILGNNGFFFTLK